MDITKKVLPQADKYPHFHLWETKTESNVNCTLVAMNSSYITPSA